MPDFCKVCGDELSRGEDTCAFGHEQALEPKSTEKLILAMQEAVTNYLEPTAYIRRRPGGTCLLDSRVLPPKYNHAESMVQIISRQRDAMFISDMIYFLDSEEFGTNARKETT